jgi:hypothetical protein
MQEEPVDTVEGLLPGLLEVGHYPEQRASLVVLACERLAPERVAAQVESAIDAVVSTDVLWTKGAFNLVYDLISCGARFDGTRQVIIDALETVAAAVVAGALHDIPRRLSDPARFTRCAVSATSCCRGSRRKMRTARPNMNLPILRI